MSAENPNCEWVQGDVYADTMFWYVYCMDRCTEISHGKHY